MELLVAILLALGSLTSPDEFTADWESSNPEAIEQAQQIIDADSYHYNDSDADGGLIVDDVSI